MQDDHFSLAMEVSTKCQVDISSVWAAWGMACLKTGNFKAAKEKFLTCFKVLCMASLCACCCLAFGVVCVLCVCVGVGLR